jgi:hypothetical protein
MFKKLYDRYKPWRSRVEIDADVLALAASMGWVELYRGEWFITPIGYEGLKKAIEIKKGEMRADVRS